MEKPRIQDDLYNHVNCEKLEELVIPDDQPCVGGFQTLAIDVEKTMINEFNEMCEQGTYPNEYLVKACKLYMIAKDTAKKEKDGIAPALNNLKKVKELNNVEDLTESFKELMLSGIRLPLVIGADTNMKDTNSHAVYVQGPKVILPDASYYKPQMQPQKEMILGIWTNIAKMIMAKTDLTPEEQETYINDTLAFDSILGGLVKTSEEWSEYVNMYNPRCVNTVSNYVKPLSFRKILKSLFGFTPKQIIVADPRFVRSFSKLFNEENFTLYKHWAYVTTLCDSCLYLTEELRDLGSMYFRTLSGVAANTPIEKFAYQIASDMYSEPVGLYYGEKYFGEEAKKDITEIKIVGC